VKGDMIDVKVGWEPKTFKADKVMQINPPKMEKFDDVSNMTYLNEASVLWNLKARYVAKLIYVRKSLIIHPSILLFYLFYGEMFIFFNMREVICKLIKNYII